MANRYWVGGTGNWSDTTKWSTTSGGAGGSAVPTGADDVFIDENSGASGSVLTLNAATRSCHSLNCVDGTGGTRTTPFTIAGSQILVVGGAAGGLSASVFKLSSGITWTHTGGFQLDNRNTGITFTTNGVSLDTINALSTLTTLTTGVTFADSCNIGTKTFTVNRGVVTFASGTTFTCGTLAVAATNTKTLDWSGATITCSAWTMAGTLANLTLTGNSSSVLNVSVSADSGIWTPGTKAYPGTVNLTATGGTVTLIRFVSMDGSTFTNLTLNGSNLNNFHFTLSTTISGVFTVNGAGQRDRVQVRTAGTAFAFVLTVNGSVVATNVDWRNIDAAGSASWAYNNAGCSSWGDLGGCSDITFDPATTRYYVGATDSNYWDSNWATTSGGSSGASMPLPQDTAVFDANTPATKINVMGSSIPRLCSITDTKGIEFTNSGVASTLYIYGDLTLASGSSITPGSAVWAITFDKISATQTITQNGGSIQINLQGQDTSSTRFTTITFGSNIETTEGWNSQTATKVNANGYNLIAELLFDSGNNASVWGPYVTLTGNAGVLLISASNDFSNTVLVFSGSTPQVSILTTGYVFAGWTINSGCVLDLNQGAGTTHVTVLGHLRIHGGGTLKLRGGTAGSRPIYRITNFSTPNATAGSPAVLQSMVAAAVVQLDKTNAGHVCLDFATITDVAFDNTFHDDYLFYAGLSSTLSNTTGIKKASCKQLGSMLALVGP